MINMLANLLVVCVIIIFLWWIANMVSTGLPPPLVKVPLIVVAIVGLILILNVLGVAGSPVFHVNWGR